MFTIEQINDLHARLGSGRTFPEYVRALKALGVERYNSYLADGLVGPAFSRALEFLHFQS